MFADRVLILAPHPDDEVVGCAAAIMRARALGARVFVAFLTQGVPDVSGLWPWEWRRRDAMVARRMREAEAAAEWLGFEIAAALPLPSRALKDHVASVLKIVRPLLGAMSIDFVWAPAYEGGHQDHDTASFIASGLARTSRIPIFEFSEYNFAGGRVRSQAAAIPNGTELLLHLDASERAIKRAALAKYRSQEKNLGYVRIDRECFRPLPAYDYALPPHPGRAFYQRFQWVPWHPRVDRCQPHDLSRRLLTARAPSPAVPG
jgi:LmbE family N-acetylglucosaminyl deacetylase